MYTAHVPPFCVCWIPNHKQAAIHILSEHTKPISKDIIHKDIASTEEFIKLVKRLEILRAFT
jgi:hypothetical protein